MVLGLEVRDIYGEDGQAEGKGSKGKIITLRVTPARHKN